MSSNDNDNDRYSGNGYGEMVSSKKECTSCEQNNVDSITESIDSVAVLDSTTLSMCAACGKEGNSDDMNTCNKCKMVKYCNAACKKKHRTKHKKKCDRRVAELHEEALFKEPPPREECPICLLTLPLDTDKSQFQTCCGKIICHGCIHAMLMSDGKDLLCAFCRMTNIKTDQDDINRLKELMNKGNANAFNYFGRLYDDGECGLPLDHQKACELYLKAGDLGCAGGYYNLGCAYRDGRGLARDVNKAKYYLELAAMLGDIRARHNLGGIEAEAGNVDRTMKHWMIAAKAGSERSLKNIKLGFRDGFIAKDGYESALRAYHERQDEMKSDERDTAKEKRGMLLANLRSIRRGM